MARSALRKLGKWKMPFDLEWAHLTKEEAQRMPPQPRESIRFIRNAWDPYENTRVEIDSPEGKKWVKMETEDLDFPIYFKSEQERNGFIQAWANASVYLYERAMNAHKYGLWRPRKWLKRMETMQWFRDVQVFHAYHIKQHALKELLSKVNAEEDVVVGRE